MKGDQIFGESQKIRGIALQFPGVLTSQAIEQMQELLVQELGQDRQRGGPWSPTLLRYFRQTLFRKMSGPMCREALTLSTIGDQLLKGMMPGTMDTLIQRLKSLEAKPSETLRPDPPPSPKASCHTVLFPTLSVEQGFAPECPRHSDGRPLLAERSQVARSEKCMGAGEGMVHPPLLPHQGPTPDS